MRCNREPLIKDPIVITFDDGFLDNWIWAYPLLKKYDLKATIFVCPEFVDDREVKRPNLEDYWRNEASKEELNQLGYLSWAEMKSMLSSGLIDIQSHTMSHTKYFVSDRLIGFHHPGNDCLYPVGNLFPKLKPYHILDPSFERRIPYGYPLFEEMSSVSARRVVINKSFTSECVSDLKRYDFKKYSFNTAFNEISEMYDEYRTDGALIAEVESEHTYHERLCYEIAGSKKILEERLHKSIEFLCWPHGEHNETAHQLALDAGYLATTTGSNRKLPDSMDRIPERIGMWHVRNNRFLSNLKTRYKIGSSLGIFPYKQLNVSYNLARYGKIRV